MVKTRAAAEVAVVVAAVAAAPAAAPAAASVSEEKKSWTLNMIIFFVFASFFFHGGYYLRHTRTRAATAHGAKGCSRGCSKHQASLVQSTASQSLEESTSRMKDTKNFWSCGLAGGVLGLHMLFGLCCTLHGVPPCMWSGRKRRYRRTIGTVDGCRTAGGRSSAGRRTVVGGARVVSGAETKSFDRGGPIWPPRSNAKYDQLGGGLGELCPPAKSRGVWGAAPPAKLFSKERKIEKTKNTQSVKHANCLEASLYICVPTRRQCDCVLARRQMCPG